MHEEMTPEQRELWLRENPGTIGKVARKHHAGKGRVSDIFNNKVPVFTPKAKKISRSLNQAIARSFEKEEQSAA